MPAACSSSKAVAEHSLNRGIWVLQNVEKIDPKSAAVITGGRERLAGPFANRSRASSRRVVDVITGSSVGDLVHFVKGARRG